MFSLLYLESPQGFQCTNTWSGFLVKFFGLTLCWDTLSSSPSLGSSMWRLSIYGVEGRVQIKMATIYFLSYSRYFEKVQKKKNKEEKSGISPEPSLTYHITSRDGFWRIWRIIIEAIKDYIVCWLLGLPSVGFLAFPNDEFDSPSRP